MVVKKIMLLMVAVAFIVSIAAPVSFAAVSSSGSTNTCSKCSKVSACNTCAKPRASSCNTCVKSASTVPCGDALKKLGRGLANCLTFPIEIPSQIAKTNNCEGPMAAVTYGVVKGVVMGVFRAVVGAYEVVTFPLPLPEGYKPILTDPEYMLENCTA